MIKNDVFPVKSTPTGPALMQKTAIFWGFCLLLSTRGVLIMLLILFYLGGKPLQKNGNFGGEGVVLRIAPLRHAGRVRRAGAKEIDLAKARHTVIMRGPIVILGKGGRGRFHAFASDPELASQPG